MPGIILAPPGSAGPPPVPVATGIQEMRWDAWDGTSWDLLNEDGMFLTQGIRGLGMPAYDLYHSESPALAGSRYRGSRAQARDVWWPLFLYADGSAQDWIAWDRAFWRTMDVDRTGVWTVVQPGGAQRSLRLRFVDDGDHAFDRDPSARGWELYAISLRADDPWWKGPAIRRTFRSTDPAGPFFPTGRISSSHTLDAAKITNPGDVDAWGVWTIEGTPTTVDVGVGGAVVEVPFALADGRVLVIDTDPRAQTAVECDAPPDGLTDEDRAAWLANELATNGNDRTADLGNVEFRPVPAGAEVPLTLSMTGAGSVTLELVPNYRRAW